MDKDKVEVLNVEETSQNVNVQSVQPVQPVVTNNVEVPTTNTSNNNDKKTPKINIPIKKILIGLGILVLIAFLVFAIIFPFLSRWTDRRKTKEGIYDSKYKVLVCTKTLSRTNELAEIDAVKIYYSQGKAKKVDYIDEKSFYNKDDAYNSALEECTTTENKKDDVLGYSKTCLINDNNVTVNKEYDLEIFDNTSKVNEQIKSKISLDQDIKEIEKIYTKDKYLCD